MFQIEPIEKFLRMTCSTELMQNMNAIGDPNVMHFVSTRIAVLGSSSAKRGLFSFLTRLVRFKLSIEDRLP